MKNIKEVVKMVKVLHEMYLNEAGEFNQFNELDVETRALLAYTLKKEYLSAYDQRGDYAGLNIYSLDMDPVDIVSIDYEDIDTQLLNFAYEGLIAIPQYFGKYKIICEETRDLWYTNTTLEIVEALDSAIFFHHAVNNDIYTFIIENLIKGTQTTIRVDDCAGGFTACGDHGINMTYLNADFTKDTQFYNLDSDKPKVEDEE